MSHVQPYPRYYAEREGHNKKTVHKVRDELEVGTGIGFEYNNPSLEHINCGSEFNNQMRRITEVESDMKNNTSNEMRTLNISKEESTPYVVVVHGPPKVGKSLLIKSLVKHYTDNTLPDITNPVTIISGEQRRIQFVECPNNVNGMIDAAKYADAVIFLIDKSYEFEMETFEFLDLLKVHGMPRVMGVLTYLDSFKDVVKLKKDTAELVDRFKAEISETAEVFCLSRLDIHGMYLEDEIRELVHLISVMELHSFSGRVEHPYVLVDRIEDVTPPERSRMDIDCTRNVILYGYLRGSDIKKGTKLHIAGVGDFDLAGVARVADPCPLPPVDGHSLEVDLDETTYSEIGRFKPGTYLMLEVRGVPSEMVNSRHPCQPILVGGISPKEENAGYMQVKLEQHSWHTNPLKTNVPIIVSVGWRRYQTTPIYALEDCPEQYQMLEHTREHVPCLAAFWGPLSPPNTRFVAVQSLANHEAAFRILATGVVLNNHAAKIVKKSMRIGTPCKIFNELGLALIEGMFTSDDEIDRFKDAKIKTKSGIWGEVNEAATKELLRSEQWKEGQPREGIAKCTFESRISKSDIVYMHVCDTVEVPRSFDPLTTQKPSNRIWQSLDTVDKNEIEKIKGHLVVSSEDGKIAPNGLREHVINFFKKRLEIGLVKKRKTLEQRRSVFIVWGVRSPEASLEKKHKRQKTKRLPTLTTDDSEDDSEEDLMKT